jgi:phage gp36-like protein
MAYCLNTDIYPKRIATIDVVQLTDDTGTKTQMDANLEAIVDEAIADAEALINGYCQKVYNIPLSPVPTLIKKYAVDISIYNLYGRRPTLAIPETIIQAQKDALNFLKLVTEGKVALGAATPVETNSPNEINISSNTGEFTRTKLQDF